MGLVNTLLIKKMHFFLMDVRHQLYPKTTSRKILICRCNQFLMLNTNTKLGVKLHYSQL